MPKEKKAGGKSKRACALEKQLAFDAKPKYKNKANKGGGDSDDSDDEGDAYVPRKLTSKTLAMAREQQAEEAELLFRKQQSKAGSSAPQARVANLAIDSDESDDDDDDGGFNDMVDDDDDELVRLQDGYVEDVEICEEDEQVLANFLMGAPERRNLADIIMSKIHEKEARDNGDEDESMSQVGATSGQTFDPKIIEVYTGVGKILQRYTSGKLPKAFKIIPSLSYWEDILWMTQPDKWSPHAMRAATRLFASNLNPKMAQRFFNIFLLEHCRQDIRDNKRLNFHLYMALKKALYKPQAFYKGIILPLCESQNCSIREAVIMGSTLAKVSVPVIHSAATLMKLAEMPYSGANSVFIKILLNKKYSLPTRVIGALATHFESFVDDSREMPVLWHQALLAFVERYKNDITKEHRELFKVLFKTHPFRAQRISGQRTAESHKQPGKMNTVDATSSIVVADKRTGNKDALLLQQAGDTEVAQPTLPLSVHVIPPGTLVESSKSMDDTMVWSTCTPTEVPPQNATIVENTEQNILSRISMLSILREQGFIDEDEFHRRKKAIIDELHAPASSSRPYFHNATGMPLIIPHAPNFQGFDAEEAIRHTFNYDTRRWETSKVCVVLDETPFAKGSLRLVYHMHHASADDGDKSSSYVAKLAIDPDEDPQTYFRDIELQAHCGHYADLYNAHAPPKRVHFIPAWVLELTQRHGALCAVERYIPGDYRKHNNNFGSVSDEDRNTPQAFSHFTYEASHHELLAVDIQGVGDMYTDPQVNIYYSNLGVLGFKKFLATHRCNPICAYLKLPPVNPKANANVGTVPVQRLMASDKIQDAPFESKHYYEQAPLLQKYVAQCRDDEVKLRRTSTHGERGCLFCQCSIQ
ncbi:hypothetical protein DYB37_005864 [Aphanomyces astaci]|uniref:Alpha-type protein kinase domain-containing protein n=1 Tax=Aphanomyces astaci TaxID=112090 RepID=A0A418F1D9_APHAT|nr:hypothetical protein DYB35_008292 [Aphanomyces astaci]RHZ22290.1 hypothetical protein DYB37_005864 [Aphanomyces astaci]